MTGVFLPRYFTDCAHRQERALYDRPPYEDTVSRCIRVSAKAVSIRQRAGEENGDGGHDQGLQLLGR